MDVFRTIAGRGEGLYKEKGSKFLGFAVPVRSDEETGLQLDLIRKQYHDARHHCYAWVLGEDGTHTKVSDDGEPSHSAGDPIHAAIRSASLTNTLVVVVRYFGGTKLGVSGLIRAYRAAAEEAIASAGVREVEIRIAVELTYDYRATNEFQQLITQFRLKSLNETFEEQCTYSGTLPRSLKNQFYTRLELLQATGVPIEAKEPGKI